MPSDPYPHSNLIYVMHFDPSYGVHELAEEAAQWRTRHSDSLKKFIRPHTNSVDPERRLKIGYVSPNFYRQAECFFVVPLLEHHDHRQFEIHCYASAARPDAVTARLQKSADAWHDVQRMTNEALAEKIRGDGIDILVDLTMHMGNKRLTLFARKPCPVQVTWLAYPGTTGLDAIDYRLTDAHMEPPEADDSWSSEKPVRLPDCWCCYEPIGEYPAVAALPALDNGYVTFGSLNTAMKHNEALLRIWATVLAALPHSRLLMLGGRSVARFRAVDFRGCRSCAGANCFRADLPVVRLHEVVQRNRCVLRSPAVQRHHHHVRRPVDGRTGGKPVGKNARRPSRFGTASHRRFGRFSCRHG